jgi:DNA adenine methylase
MTARPDPATIEPLLHTASGEPPKSKTGLSFLDSQGEVFEPDREGDRGHSAHVGVLALDNGKWLAWRSGFSINDPQHDTREAALRNSIAYGIRRWRNFECAKHGEKWPYGAAGKVIEWALSLKSPVSREGKPVDGPESVTVAQPSSDREASQSSGASHDTKSDPIVAELVAPSKARKVFPADHTVAMTNPVVNGQPKTVGTCTCGAVFSFAWGQHEKMDAAIEAHWQNFDDLSAKVDGKGQPISETAAGRLPTQPAASESTRADSPAPQPPARVDSPIAEDGDDLLKRAESLAWTDVADLPEQVIVARRGDVGRPILRWHGGKWKLARWLMGFFPEHRIYVEPFGGAGSVLIRKPRVYAEIYNDLDDVVVNLFRVLRDDAKSMRLIEALRVTPFAREEFTDALEAAEDDIERARHLIVRSYMGFGSNAHSGSAVADKTGFKSYTRPDDYRSTGFRANSNRSGTTPAHDWANYPDALPAIVERLRGVIVEQRPAIDVMRQHDGPATLHYVDPPYLPETRSPSNKYDLKHRMYRHELTPDDHRELLTFLKTLEGFVILSGYPAPLYDEALPDWRRETCAAHADGARERTEVVWLNPACAAALDHRHPVLFDLAAFDEANAPPLELESAEP